MDQDERNGVDPPDARAVRRGERATALSLTDRAQ